MSTIQAVRGMNDITPEEIPRWHLLEVSAREVLAIYGFREIRTPIVERTELFRRSIGEVTDIVEKEMYTFVDRSGDSLTLRPECTASCVRAAVERGLIHNQSQRLWYMGPMFRHERPQKGRYRQFHQIGAEALGLDGAEVDAELILITARLWRVLGLDELRLEINTLGSRDTQSAYRMLLVEYFSDHRQQLDEDSDRRLNSNPLRILDSKNQSMKALIEAAPRLMDHLDAASADHFEELRQHLDACGQSYTVNARLVRGLDYYTRTVFEWTTDRLGAQNAVCGGGRYDGLVAEIGGNPTPASGFAIGMERMVALLADAGIVGPDESADVFVAASGERARLGVHPLAERLRDELAGCRVVVDATGASFKSKLRRADRSGARVALILGDEELSAGTVGVKDLRGDGGQRSLPQPAVSEHVRELVLRKSGN